MGRTRVRGDGFGFNPEVVLSHGRLLDLGQRRLAWLFYNDCFHHSSQSLDFANWIAQDEGRIQMARWL